MWRLCGKFVGLVDGSSAKIAPHSAREGVLTNYGPGLMPGEEVRKLNAAAKAAATNTRCSDRLCGRSALTARVPRALARGHDW
jgi:hypothetical protein